MKKFLLMFCLMSLSVVCVKAEKPQEEQKQQTTLLAGCPCKDKGKKNT